MRMLVTRPAQQADEWAKDLRAQGLDAVALPLIAISPAVDAMPLRAAWQTLARHRLAVFVSPNAVEHFFAARPAGTTWPGGTCAASPGPGTTRALLALGVPAAQLIEPAADATQFDSEALWQQLRSQPWRDAEVLLVRGDGGRDWLADTLRAQGARVTPLSAYRRGTPALDAAQRATLQAALAAPAAHLWFFSSSEAIVHLQTIAPPDTQWAQARAICTHPRIAATARQCGFIEPFETRPSLAAVVACIQSIAT